MEVGFHFFELGFFIFILNFFKDVITFYIMKRIVLLLALFSLVFVGAEVTLGEVLDVVGEKASDVGKNTDIYANVLGENLLKFQEFFIGALGFVSLGFFDVSSEMDFARFLFAILLFMLLYSLVGFVFDKFNFGIAFIITLLAFIGMDDKTIEIIFLNYEAMGIIITVILPVFILLAFTFRVYWRAYEGKSKVSPFYTEMGNLVFLIFFGWFFIRHSRGEEGAIAVMRFALGWALIGMGIGQTVFYKIFAKFLHIQKVKERRLRKDIRKMKQDFIDAKNEIELEALNDGRG